MRGFILGVLLTLLGLVGGGYYALTHGYLDVNADSPIPQLEGKIASQTVDASVERHASKSPNPTPEDAASLKQGMTIYVMNCSSCHGTLDKKPNPVGRNLYPHAPQLIIHPLDDPEWRTFYVVKHGISRTGMPAWNNILSEQDMWRVTAFLSHLERLPPEVQQLMPAPAAGAR